MYLITQETLTNHVLDKRENKESRTEEKNVYLHAVDRLFHPKIIIGKSRVAYM